jgi:magnesium transporter
MTIEFVSILSSWSVEEAIAHLRKVALEAEIIHYVYVIDDKNCLVGVLSAKDLLIAKDKTLVKDIMSKNVIQVRVETDQEEVARIISKYDLLAIPVVDGEDHILGIVTVDDIVDVITEEATEDIYKSAGVSNIEGAPLIVASVFNLVKTRLPWLIISLLGGLVAGSIIGFFEGTLEKVIVLAMFIPVIMDMGGNVSTQSSTIFVRGIATGEIPISKIWPYFLREIKIGAAIGMFSGILLAIIAALWLDFPMLGVVVGISLFSTIVVAASVGILVPLIVHRFKFDPALAAGPFVTSIKDVTGLLIYFTIAVILLEL